ncbi:MAG: hypothetical protein SWY16_21920 [Cyanobacteriota bacterium]|nr:hypothetical protein [Cyanobacteriota bacterium]
MSHRSLATWLLLISLGIVGIVGCGSGSEDTATTEGDQTTEETTGDVAQNGEDGVPVEPFSTEPTEPETEPRTQAAPAGLINSTNPDERVQEVQSRINGNGARSPEDPFEVLTVEPLETLEPPEEAVAQAPAGTSPGGGTTANNAGGGGGNGGGTTANNAGGGGGNGGGTTANNAGGGGGNGGGTTANNAGGGGGNGGNGGNGQPAVSLPPLSPTVAQVAEPLPDQPDGLFAPQNETAVAQLPPELDLEALPSSLPTGPEGTPLALPPLESQPVASLPPLPTEIGPAIPPEPPTPPTISENVEVTGVAEVGGEVQVIVQLPGSSSGRYVRVGDLIAGGRVLIKRVEGIQSTEPIVILEEDGSEYPRFLGESPTIAMEDSEMG